MESRVKLLGHAIHPMLIVFPLGLLSTAVLFDGLSRVVNLSQLATASYHMIAVGVVMGLVAGVFGLIDWTAIPAGTRAKRIGLWHAITNVAVLGLFVASYILRAANPEHPGALALILSSGGLGLALVSGWLGGELIERLGVSVDTGANVNAPSSLKGLLHSTQRS
jgi:uncharacterized membrane protein